MDHLEASQTKEDEVVTHLQKDNQNGYTSHCLIPQKKVVDKLVKKIKNKTVDIQTFQGFSRGRLDQVLQSLSPFKRKHHVFFGTTSRELSLPIELTNNQVEIQLIPAEDVRRDLSKMKPEVANTMKWIHIGAIQLVVKSALYPGTDTPIDIVICDKRVTNSRDSVLGAFSGNLYAKQIIAELYPQIAYNIQDAAFSRALTLYQDYKRKDILTGGNRPYSITYQVSYTLSNSHHTNLFLEKDFIEIPEICKEVAKAISPDQVEIPQIREIDIQIGDKQVLKYDQSLRLKAPRLSFQGERLTSRPLERSFSHFYERKAIQEAPVQGIRVKLKCPEGWRNVSTKFDTTERKNQFPCNTLYYLANPENNRYIGILEIGGFEIQIEGKAGQEADVLILGRNFLDNYQPWSRKASGMEITIDEKRLLIK
ncbi:uncharacterized protein LOC131008285 [Salvia miltiorrhiza]|uniref:uncharacterized protein LOC131008285 n=1 Tax=Salvia miltiorrhiza TaxID=226208 RepID=UPI0025ACAD2F|nr:uncharacterized protein LOC131008285 [Salvia miltiorrhiza]